MGAIGSTCLSLPTGQLAQLTTGSIVPKVVSAGVAHIDLLQYFDTQTTNDNQARLVSTQRLNESSMLVSTKPSETVTRSESGHEQQATAYSLRLPLASPKASSSDILNGLASEPHAQFVAGSEYIEIQVEPADVSQIEETFWQQLVALVDYDSSGTLDKDVRCCSMIIVTR